jgi:hypothetical protein
MRGGACLVVFQVVGSDELYECDEDNDHNPAESGRSRFRVRVHRSFEGQLSVGPGLPSCYLQSGSAIIVFL